MLPNRTEPLLHAPLYELLYYFLRQFKRLLAECGLSLSDHELEAIAQSVVERQGLSEQAVAVRDALVDAVAESEAVLAQWHLSFEQALDASLDAVPGWESTADFLELAAEKSNAELRIAAGSAMVTVLGDLRYVHHVLFLARRPQDDVEPIVARRVLLFLSGVEMDDPTWLAKVREWVDNRVR